MSTLNHKVSDLSSEKVRESDLKLAIINRLWDRSLDGKALEDAYYFEAYFSHYISRGRNPGSITHSQVLEITGLLKDRSLDRQAIRLRYRDTHSQDPDLTDDLIDSLIDAAVHLWLMIYTTSSRNPKRSYLSGVSHFDWEDSKSLKDLVEQNVFPKRSLDGNKRLPAQFDVLYLEKIADIKVFWTNNLADHLSMTHNDSRVIIFHHAALLRYMQTHDIFSRDLLTETLKTLRILLPPTAENMHAWFDKQQELVREGTECPVLDPLVLETNDVDVTTRKLDQFVYWGERLEYLLQVYDEHEPKTLIQWIRDDRRPAQRWTFWIAALAFVIATLSLVAAVLQTWASLASYKLVQAQAGSVPAHSIL